MVCQILPQKVNTTAKKIQSTHSPTNSTIQFECHTGHPTKVHNRVGMSKSARAKATEDYLVKYALLGSP